MDIDDPAFDPISFEGEARVFELRSNILEGLGLLEGNLDKVIGLYLTSDMASLTMLSRDLLPRVPYGTRIDALLKLLAKNEELDDYPYLQLFKAVVGVRNTLAHATLNVYESSNEDLVFESRRRGADHVERLTTNHLKEINLAIWHVSVDLWLLHGVLFERFDGGHFDRDQPEDLYGG